MTHQLLYIQPWFDEFDLEDLHWQSKTILFKHRCELTNAVLTAMGKLSFPVSHEVKRARLY